MLTIRELIYLSCIHIYIYICVCIHVYIYFFLHIYIHNYILYTHTCIHTWKKHERASFPSDIGNFEICLGSIKVFQKRFETNPCQKPQSRLGSLCKWWEWAVPISRVSRTKAKNPNRWLKLTPVWSIGMPGREWLTVRGGVVWCGRGAMAKWPCGPWK